MSDLRRWGRLVGATMVGLTGLLLAGCSSGIVPLADGTRAALHGGGASPTPTTAPTTSIPAPINLATDRLRQGAGVIASGGPAAPYNYAPTVLEQAGHYRMWWCSQLPGAARPGDQILYAQSASAQGPFLAPGGAAAAEVFGNSAAGFDTLHTCDPSVIVVNGTSYLYYTGTSNPAGQNNAIGLATSTDGVNWSRANGGAPIVTAAGDVARANAYGVGQPAAVFRDGWFYLMFTDTTGQAANPDGGGQFVLRARDAAFTVEVQALDAQGFAAVANTHSPRLQTVASGNSDDLMWVDALNAFAIAQDGSDGTTITFWDSDFSYHPYQPVKIGGAASEGAGFVRRADGHAPVDTQDPCGRVQLDVVRSTTKGAGPTNLAAFGVDVHGFNGCATRAAAAAVLNGFAIPAADRTMDLVVNGTLVDVERRSVAVALAEGVLDSSVAALANLPVVARLPARMAAVVAADRPVAVVTADGRLWVVGQAVAALNSSVIATVSDQQWDAHPRGQDLSALRF